MKRCSFCGRAEDQVKKLVAGQKIGDQTVYICDDCARLAAAPDELDIRPRMRS